MNILIETERLLIRPPRLEDAKHINIAITRLAFEYFSAVRVQICAQRENIKSTNVAKRAGFIEEAILKNFMLDCVSKKPCDKVIYACCDKEMLPALDFFKVTDNE